MFGPRLQRRYAVFTKYGGAEELKVNTACLVFVSSVFCNLYSACCDSPLLVRPVRFRSLSEIREIAGPQRRRPCRSLVSGVSSLSHSFLRSLQLRLFLYVVFWCALPTVHHHFAVSLHSNSSPLANSVAWQLQSRISSVFALRVHE